MLYRVQATLTHYTTDSHGVSAEIPQSIPTFYVKIPDDAHPLDAEVLARKILEPFDLQYETVKISTLVIQPA